MKLHEFRRLIDIIDDSTSHDNYEVVIKLKNDGTIGGSTVIPVKHVFQGFDFDSGKIIITTTTKDILTNAFSNNKNTNYLKQLLNKENMSNEK